MLTMVEVRTSRGDVLTLPIGDPSYGLLVRDIEGLDPVKATLVSSSFAQQDGEQYHSSQRGSRNLVFKIGLEPSFIGETVRGLRDTLYNIFMPKTEVHFRYHSEGYPTLDISGRVESFECPMFVEDPMATISVVCHNPDFYDRTPIIFEGMSVADDSEYTIEYKGTVDTGVKFSLLVDRTITTGMTLHHRSGTDEISSLSVAVPMGNGNTLEINTNPGKKEAVIDGISMLYGVSPYAQWIALTPGTNYIRVFVEGAPVPYTLEYTHKYGGI